MRLRPGDGVGFVGYSFNAYWARLARLKIVAEVVPPEAHQLRVADAGRRAEVMAAFARAGAVAVITDRIPEDRAIGGWEPVGDIGYRLYRTGRVEPVGAAENG